jgi:hypothetical protein
MLSYKSYYQQLEGVYYTLDFTVLMLSFMFLARIKNPEQLKHINSFDFGKLLGIDRVPEAKCLRERISDIADQNKADDWMKHLFKSWLGEVGDEGFFFYVDGHVQVYHGYKANLGKKHVSRQKLCLPGTSQFWINDQRGNPYLYINAPVNEKMQQMLHDEIIPQIKEQVKNRVSEQELQDDPDQPLFTMVFDREAYSPKFFSELWTQERIAIITYRKNVKDQWDEADFTDYSIETEGDNEKMKLCEKEVEIDGVTMREIRRLTDNGHQTSIITTNKKLTLIFIALYMFTRWCQENFFRYMRQEYALDRIYQYLVKQLDESIEVVNPEHTKLTQQIKKEIEKINRRKAELYKLVEENCMDSLENSGKYEKRQAKLHLQIEELMRKVNQLKEERASHHHKIPISEMPPQKRYNQIKPEGNQFLNIIKMICYRAETSLIASISPTFSKYENEKRAFLKSLIKRTGDIIPDYKNKTITTQLYSLSTPRENQTLEKLCQILNDTETCFPGTDMRLFFKIATV